MAISITSVSYGDLERPQVYKIGDQHYIRVDEDLHAPVKKSPCGKFWLICGLLEFFKEDLHVELLL